MIEKLKVVIKPEDWKLPVNELEMRCLKNLLLKVDELVDAVNWLGKSETEIRPTNMYDLYVKNRHLIGKLCKFKWGQGCYYGILTNIKRKPTELPFESNGRAFRTCEPVKPYDNIIYKGE